MVDTTSRVEKLARIRRLLAFVEGLSVVIDGDVAGLWPCRTRLPAAERVEWSKESRAVIIFPRGRKDGRAGRNEDDLDCA